MPTTTLTVKLINPPGSTGRGSIVGMDDQRLGVFSEKVGLFEVGKTYEIEFTETDRGGKTLRNVKSATLKAGASPPAQQAAAVPSNGNGNGNGHYRPTDPTDAKRIFVCANLTAMIRAGKVDNTKESVWATTQLLCQVYDHTFGNNTFRASEAGKPRLVAAE
jgi:hypothetical protein